jgi:hypothetical protein
MASCVDATLVTVEKEDRRAPSNRGYRSCCSHGSQTRTHFDGQLAGVPNAEICSAKERSSSEARPRSTLHGTLLDY